jgi:hypothetical protein
MPVRPDRSQTVQLKFGKGEKRSYAAPGFDVFNLNIKLERATRFEPATLTLAR